MKLSLYEQETIILYNQAEATAEVYWCGSRIAPSAARLPANGPRPPGTNHPSRKRAASEHGRERL